MTTVKIVAVSVFLCSYLWVMEITQRQVNLKVSVLVTALEDASKAH